MKKQRTKVPLWAGGSQAITVEGIFGSHPDISFPRAPKASWGTGLRTAEHWAGLGPGSLKVREGGRLGAQASNLLDSVKPVVPTPFPTQHMDTTKTWNPIRYTG